MNRDILLTQMVAVMYKLVIAKKRNDNSELKDLHTKGQFLLSKLY